jgi:hypothetical protein
MAWWGRSGGGGELWGEGGGGEEGVMEGGVGELEWGDDVWRRKEGGR